MPTTSKGGSRAAGQGGWATAPHPLGRGRRQALRRQQQRHESSGGRRRRQGGAARCAHAWPRLCRRRAACVLSGSAADARSAAPSASANPCRAPKPTHADSHTRHHAHLWPQPTPATAALFREARIGPHRAFVVARRVTLWKLHFCPDALLVLCASFHACHAHHHVTAVTAVTAAATCCRAPTAGRWRCRPRWAGPQPRARLRGAAPSPTRVRACVRACHTAEQSSVQ